MSTDNVPVLEAFNSALSQLGVTGEAQTDIGDSARCFLSSKKERRHFQQLVDAAIQHLGTKLPSLRQLNVILKSIQCNVVVLYDPPTESDSATLFVVRTLREAFVLSTPSSDSTVPVPRDSQSLRSTLQSTKLDELPPSVVDPPSPIWASVLMEILLFEMENFSRLYEEGLVDESYRGRCMHCLRRLSGRFFSLPPSYFIYDAVRESQNSVAGGGFADIWLGRLDGRRVCLKVLRFHTSTTPQALKNLAKTFCREALCWARLDHPNILPFLGVNEQIAPYQSFCLISPWMDHGNLMSFLESNPNFDRLKAVIDTAQGMRYLHELDPPIVHADIRGANILVTNELRCCLADFGLAVATEMTITSVRQDGTVPWMAPEIITEIAPETTPSPTRDIFAFGCTMLEIFSGKSPFDGLILPVIIHKVLNRERPSRPAAGSSPQEITDQIWAVITSCWKHNATKRPSARKVLRNLGVPPAPRYTILRRPDPGLTVEVLLEKLRSDKEYLLQLMPTAGENPSQAFLTIIEDELTRIEVLLNIHDKAISGLLDLNTALASNTRHSLPRLINDPDLELPIEVCYEKYKLDQGYLCRLLAMEKQAARKAFVDKINEEFKLVIARVSEISQMCTHVLASAVREGKTEEILDLIKKGADVNTIVKNCPYATALQLACSRGHNSLVAGLLDHGADLNIHGGKYRTVLVAAAYAGHRDTVEILLDRGADINIQGGHYGTALQAAVHAGQQDTVRILLDCGADINKQGGKYGTALQAAACAGHRDTVEILLDRGADINIQAGRYGTAIQAAVSAGHRDIVKILLDRGADINIQGGTYGTVLQAAACRRHQNTIEILLDWGADINIQGGHYGTALQAAAYTGQLEIIRLLLDKGADINIQGGYYGTALQAAVYAGQRDTVEILLDQGADINIQGGYYGTVLQAAACAGHRDIVEILLDRGADINIQGGRYGTETQAAASAGHRDIVKILLDQGADINVEDDYYGTPLQAAVQVGHWDIVEILLDRGADINIEGGRYGTVLVAAVYAGQLEIIRMLLDRGADINIEDDYYRTPLQAAAQVGHWYIVEILLDWGADINIQGDYYGTALRTAAQAGHRDIVEMLLDRGADINIQGDYYGTALQTAAQAAHRDIVEILLDRGADINIQGGTYGTALQAASRMGYVGIVHTLLDHRADVNAQGGKYGTALNAANYCGTKKLEIQQLLVAAGADPSVK